MTTRQELLDEAIRMGSCALCGRTLGPGPIATAGEWIVEGASEMLVMLHAHEACADKAGWKTMSEEEAVERWSR